LSITASLSTAFAVFLGLEAAALALTVWPPAQQGRRTHGALMGAAVLVLLALSLLSGNG
jgi:hypothetical protein